MPSSKNGKKQKKGVYFTNGVSYRPVSHRYFKPGLKVINNKTGEVGIILEKDKKMPRSMIKVQFSDIQYIRSNLLHLFEYYSNEQKKILIKCDLHNRRNNNNKSKNVEKLHKGKNIQLHNAKKLLISKLSNGIYVDVDENGKSKYKMELTGEEFIDNIIKINYENLLKYHNNINDKNLGVNDFRLTKDIVLKLFYYSSSKSSNNYISYISTKEDYYKIVNDYLNIQVDNLNII